MPYQAGISEYTIPKPSGQIALVQVLFTPSYVENKPICFAKEIKGGVHPVKYLSHLLVDNLYDGIFSSRREEGIIAYVKFLDDDTPHKKYYKLINMPGLQMSDWELFSGSVLTPSNPQTVANIPARNALLPEANKFVNVSDARTPEEITGGHAPYSRSYIADGVIWLPIYGIGDVDPSEVAANSAARHTRNNDTQLKDSLSNPVSADELRFHLSDTSRHRQINDINEAGAANELYSSLKVIAKIQTAIANLINLAPATLNTLFELANALGNDPEFATTVLNILSQKFDKSGGSIGRPDENGYTFRILNKVIENFKDESASSKFSFEANTFRLSATGLIGTDEFSFIRGTENDLWVKFDQITLDGLTVSSQIFTESMESGSYRHVTQGLIADATNVIYWEAPFGQVAKVVLGSNCFIQNILLPIYTTNSEYILFVYQDAVGGRTMTFGDRYKFPSGIPVPINSGPNQFTVFRFFYDGVNHAYSK